MGHQPHPILGLEEVNLVMFLNSSRACLLLHVLARVLVHLLGHHTKYDPISGSGYHPLESVVL